MDAHLQYLHITAQSATSFIKLPYSCACTCTQEGKGAPISKQYLIARCAYNGSIAIIGVCYLNTPFETELKTESEDISFKCCERTSCL